MEEKKYIKKKNIVYEYLILIILNIILIIFISSIVFKKIINLLNIKLLNQNSRSLVAIKIFSFYSFKKFLYFEQSLQSTRRRKLSVFFQSFSFGCVKTWLFLKLENCLRKWECDWVKRDLGDVAQFKIILETSLRDG